MLKRIVDGVEVVAVVAAVVTVGFLFAPGESTPSAANDVGASVYSANCASCHSADGSGGAGPPLADGVMVDAYPDAADQVTVIAEGRAAMPSFGDRLSAEEIEAVTAYTRDEL